MLNLLKTNIMKTRSAFLTFLIASLFCFGCSSQAQKSTSQNQNNKTMETTNQKNPYYSRTDTTVLNALSLSLSLSISLSLYLSIYLSRWRWRWTHLHHPQADERAGAAQAGAAVDGQHARRSLSLSLSLSLTHTHTLTLSLSRWRWTHLHHPQANECAGAAQAGAAVDGQHARRSVDEVQEPLHNAVGRDRAVVKVEVLRPPQDKPGGGSKKGSK